VKKTIILFFVFVLVVSLSFIDSCSWRNSKGYSRIDFEYGSHDYPMNYDDEDRIYRVHIPLSYDGSSSVPLLVVFHATGGTSKGIEGNTKFSKISDQEGFIVVYPQSLIGGNKDSPSKTGWWFRQNEEGYVDDKGFVQELISGISSELNIDENKIFAGGSSNGAVFTHYLAYTLPNTFAGVFSVGGTIGENSIKSSEPVPIIMFNGKLDGTVPYEGKKGAASIPDAFAQWGENNNCKGDVIETEILDYNSVKKEYQNCDANTVSYVVLDGVHTYYAWASPIIWDFFSEQDK